MITNKNLQKNPLKKEIVFTSSIPSDILNTYFTTKISIAPTTTIFTNTTPPMAKLNNGTTSFHHNTITSKISLRRKISINSLNADPGITQLTLPLVLNQPTARPIPYHPKSNRHFASLLKKTFELDEFNLLNHRWPHPSFLSRKKMERYALHKITANLTTSRSKITIHSL